MWSVLFVTVFFIPVALPYAIPEKLERCHLKDANLDDCLKTTIEKGIRFIGTTGIPSLNLPPIEPLEAIKLEIGAGSSAINLVQKYEDVKIYGYVDAQVEDAHLDLDKKELTFTTYVPKITQKAKYDVNGKILMMPLFGKGDSIITLSEKLERCHLKDANLDDCLKTTVEKGIRFIGTTGIPSINLPPIDPLEAIKLEIGAGSSVVNLVQKYEDVKMYGFVDSQVEDAHLDMDKKELTFTTYAPKVTQKGKYDINGKILMLPLFGKGYSIISLFGLKIKHKINFEEEIKKHKRYFKITSYVARMSVKDAHFDFQNLFNGDKQLADNILKVLNENGGALIDDDKEAIQRTYAEIFKNVATRLFHNVPIDEIFLP